MSDSYVCSGATMRCTMGTSPARLTVLPVRTVYLTGQPMANISDHKSMVNLAPFGLCRSLGYPATASATAANHGHLTPMPCMHNTPMPWMNGKMDYLIKGQPALLKSCKCQCMWGGTISLVTDGQVGEGTQYVQKKPKESFVNNPAEFVEILPDTPPTSEPTTIDNQALLADNANSNAGATSSNGFNQLDIAQNHLAKLRLIYAQKKPNEVLKDIPTSWVKAYNNSVKNINEKYKEGGIAAVYSDVEHIYNIYQLATSRAAKDYGLNKLSDKTPYQVFEIARKVPGFIDKMPKKEFWDSFDKFVPLYTNVGFKSDAYFSPTKGCVVISMTDTVNPNKPNAKSVADRMKDSDWYKSGLLYHEFGHAMDHKKGWRNNSEFLKVYEDFKKEVTDSDIKKKLEEYIDKKGGISKLTKDEIEKLMSLSDSIQAATPGHASIPPGGHPTAYFASEDKQMAEMIAHMSENYWSGNDIYESLAPESYKKMRELIEKKWK